MAVPTVIDDSTDRDCVVSPARRQHNNGKPMMANVAAAILALGPVQSRTIPATMIRWRYCSAKSVVVAGRAKLGIAIARENCAAT